MLSTLHDIQQGMSRYGLSMFYTFGTFGNFVLICILLQGTHRRNPCSLYLLSATIVNFILIQCILPVGIHSAYHVDPQTTSLVWCKIRSYLFNALLMLYRWYKMAAGLDRAAMCSRHVWIRRFSEIKIAKRVITIITIIWLLIPIHLAVFYQIEAGRCVPQSGTYSKFFSAYSIFISGWSPPIFMTIFGLIAFKNLKEIRSRILPSQPKQIPIMYQRRITRRDQQLMILLMSEVLLYVCTNLLFSINITYSAVTANHPKSMERIDIESFIAYISTPFLIIINNCAPFYLYLLVSGKFREDVKMFFCHWKTNAQQNIARPPNQPALESTTHMQRMIPMVIDRIQQKS